MSHFHETTVIVPTPTRSDRLEHRLRTCTTQDHERLEISLEVGR